MAQLPFIGDDRRQLVDLLLDAFDEVAADRTPRLVTLEADPGWGKSRVVQEFYRRLAAERQSGPGYWPSSILDAVADGESQELGVEERRKRVYPERFVPPEGSVPQWFWWGISATARRSGSAVQSLAIDLAQVEAHTTALEARWRQVSGRRERLSQFLSRDEAKSLGGAASEEAVATGLEKLFEASVPGLGLLWWAGRLTWAQRDRWSSERQARPVVDVLAARHVDLVEHLASGLGHFADAGIPIVVVVEDAHDADAALVDLLVRTVADRRGPVLIVLTAWPGLMADHERAANRLVTEIPIAASMRLLPDRLTELTFSDRLQLVTELLDDAGGAALESLARRYTNPFALELVCQLDRVRDLIEDGELTPKEVSTLPADVEGLYQAMWESLPSDLREALMLAVLASPAGVGEVFDDRSWDVHHAVHVWGSLDWLTDRAPGLSDQLEGQAYAHAWVRTVDQWLQSCHETAQHDVASRAARNRLTDSRLRRYLEGLGDHIDLSDPNLAPARRRAQAQLLVTLASREVVDWTDTVIDAADTLIDEASEAHDVDSMRTVMRLASMIPRGQDPRDLDRRHLYAEALGQVGRVSEAVAEFEDLVLDRERSPEQDDYSTLGARTRLATWLGEAGRVSEAITQFEQLITDRERIFGTDDEESLIARNNLAHWLGEAGRQSEAVVQFEALLEDQHRVLGAEHLETLTTRNNLANRLGETGQVWEAIERFEVLLTDRTRLLGDEDPHTLATRNNLAFWLGEGGQFERAVDQFSALLNDQDRLLGTDHPHTLATRMNLAAQQGDAGDVSEAIEQFEFLLDDMNGALGLKHPFTLAARAALAEQLGAAGRLPEAVDVFEQLVAARTEVLGADHPETLGTRERLAVWLARQGRVAEGLMQLEQLRDDRQRTLGSEHLDTARTQRLIEQL